MLLSSGFPGRRCLETELDHVAVGGLMVAFAIE